ncbi:MAG: oligosaccharide flippase family protein [Proteobacteria bacterium]|nr:oligosaccharide flippase family protein [Pseudomonadota bacterium]
MSEQDKAYAAAAPEDPQKSIRRGFLWIGTASIITQIFDAISFFVVMLYITKYELGVATLAVSLAVMVEAFNGLGVGTALLQDSKLTQNETHSVFWFATLLGVGLVLLLVPIAWPLAHFYRSDVLVPLFIAGTLKLALVSTATIPLQLINRRLEFHKVSAINTATTGICGIVKIVLAATGFGAWALVLANTLYGLGALVGAFLFSGYRPRLHFRWSECRRFVVYGIKHCAASVVEQFNKNLHYMLVGKFLGEGVLGMYRAAYELAMTPALALFAVVNRSSFPVFAKIKDNRPELSRLFSWNQRNVAFFAAIPLTFILFASEGIFMALGNADWYGAVPLIPFVLALGFFRVIIQTFPELYRACTSPGYSMLAAGVELALLSVTLTAALFFFQGDHALKIMLVAWMCLYVPLVLLHCRLAQRFVEIRLRDIAMTWGRGLSFFAMAAIALLPAWHYRENFPFEPWGYLACTLLIMAACTVIFARFVLKVNLRALFKKRQ